MCMYVCLCVQNNMAAPQAAETYAALKDDPDMKHVFEDVVANGPAAFQVHTHTHIHIQC